MVYGTPVYNNNNIQQQNPQQPIVIINNLDIIMIQVLV